MLSASPPSHQPSPKDAVLVGAGEAPSRRVDVRDGTTRIHELTVSLAESAELDRGIARLTGLIVRLLAD